MEAQEVENIISSQGNVAIWVLQEEDYKSGLNVQGFS